MNASDLEFAVEVLRANVADLRSQLGVALYRLREARESGKKAQVRPAGRYAASIKKRLHSLACGIAVLRIEQELDLFARAGPGLS